MRNNQHGSTTSLKLPHLLKTLILKAYITYCQHLIYNEYLRLQMRRNCKCETDIHATGIALDWCIQKLFNFSECNYFIEFFLDLSLAHAKDGAVKEYVFPSGEFRMKARADFQQTGNPALDRGFT